MKLFVSIILLYFISTIAFSQTFFSYDWMNFGFFIGRGDYLENVVLDIDSKGNLINVGSEAVVTTAFYIHKISSSGELSWKLDNLTREKHEGKILDLIVDEKDNIYVGGYLFTAFPLTEIDTLFVQKIIEVNGLPQIEWEYRHIIGDDYVNIDDRQFKLTKYDSTLIIAGITINRSPLADITTIKLDTNGTELWKRHFTNEDNYDVSPQDLAVDKYGNIYVLGNSVKEDSSSTQLIKYNNNGDLLWGKKITYSNTSNISAVDLEISNRNTWLSAKSPDEIILLKIDSIGNTVKEIRRETSGSNLGLSIDESQNVYQINNDSVFKYDSTGNLVSSVELPSLSNVKYSYFTVDEDHNIYIVGQRTHFYTVKLNENLEFEFAFETAWKDPPHLHREFSEPYDIAVSSSHEIYISGNLITWDSLNFNSYEEQVSVKYSHLPTDVKEIKHIPSKFLLYQNYPNPFNPTTKIKYTIPQNTHPSIPSREGKELSDRGVLAMLKVYDILGKEVATLVNKRQPPGNYQVEFDGDYLPSGVYFYRLQSGSFIETKKMVMLR